MAINSGSENLEVMREAKKYMTYVGKLVAASIPKSGEIIEFGAGNGTQTIFVGIDRDRLVCVESDQRMQEVLTGLDFTVVGDLSELQEHKFAGAYSINCLEHIDDDCSMLQELHAKLKLDSKLVVYVPALPMLFSSMDRRVGHVRRYTKKSLRSVLEESGYSISEIRYVDSLGALVTLVFKMLRNKTGQPSRNSVIIYDKFIFPISKIIDRATGQLVGKNLFAVARRI